MTDRSRYLQSFLNLIANEVRNGLREIPENWEGIQAVTAALDSFEHEALLDPRGAGTRAAFDHLKEYSRRFCPSIYPEVLDGAYNAIRNAPESESEAESRAERQRAYRNDMLRQYAAMAQGQSASEQWNNWRSIRDLMGVRNLYSINNDEAEKRALELLVSNLSKTQRNEWEQNKWFHVVGSSSKRTYRIHDARQLNILELTKKGEPKCTWCFLPSGGVAKGDVLLAQKVSLETDEKEALKVANRFGPEVCYGRGYSRSPVDDSLDAYAYLQVTSSQRVNPLFSGGSIQNAVNRLFGR